MQLFGIKGKKFHHCPGTKEQRDKLKILHRDGMGQPKSGTGQAGTAKSGTGHETKRDRAEKDVLKQEKDVLKQKRIF